MKLTWNDYQAAMNRDNFERIDRATLESLSMVCPPAIKNPTAQALYDNARERIQRRLAQLDVQPLTPEVPGDATLPRPTEMKGRPNKSLLRNAGKESGFQATPMARRGRP